MSIGKISLLFALLAVVCRASADSNISASDGFAGDSEREAIYGALKNAESALKFAPFKNKTIAILPIPNDKNGLLTGRLKNILTSQGYICVEGKEDPMWNEIIKEFIWDERKDDILDQNTLAKFGKLKAAQILLYGKIRVFDQNSDRIYAELDLHAADIATKQHIWGGNFACRFYKNGKELQGIIKLNHELRQLLKKNFDDAKKSLQDLGSIQKTNHIKTVSVIPLAGDIDQYITGLAIEMLAQTRFQPKNPRIPSVAEMRSFARDSQADCDAFLYGAIRDLHRTTAVTKQPSMFQMQSVRMIHADIQLFLEDAKSGVVLWSRTITISEPVSVTRAMSAAELRERYLPGLIAAVIIFAVLVFAAVTGFKMYISYHNVR